MKKEELIAKYLEKFTFEKAGLIDFIASKETDQTATLRAFVDERTAKLTETLANLTDQIQRVNTEIEGLQTLKTSL